MSNARRDDAPEPIAVRPLAPEEAMPYDLLMEADPSQKALDAYLPGPGIPSRVFIVPAHGDENEIRAVLVLLTIDETCIEIKNIAVGSNLRGRGIGLGLLEFARRHALDDGYRTLRIGTGNSSLDQLRFYQKFGFRMMTIVRDFFMENYSEPLFENGLQCRDMVVLEMDLV